MKTSYIVSVALKIVGIIFILKILIYIPTELPNILLTLSILKNPLAGSSPNFTLPLILLAIITILSLCLIFLLIIFSERIALFLVRSNDKEIGLMPQWAVNDILYISIQIFALIVIIKSVSYFISPLSSGIFLLFNYELIEKFVDTKHKVQMGIKVISGGLFLIIGFVLFFVSDKITNLLDRYYRKKRKRPNKSLEEDAP